MLTSQQLDALRPSLEEEVDTDVLVVGGGTAGFIAAVAAARSGAQTILAECMPFLGGTHGGAGNVMGGTGFYHTYLGERREQHSDKKTPVVRGFAQEYMNRLIAVGAAAGTLNKPPEFIANDVELTKVVTEEMVEEAGADIWFRTQLTEVVVDDGQVAGALVSRGGGLTLIRTNIIVDASGDGEAAYRAGAAYELGRSSDGRPQPATMFFDIGGVDLHRLLKHLEEFPEHLRASRNRRSGDTNRAVRLANNLNSGIPFTMGVTCGYDEALKNEDVPCVIGASKPMTGLGSIYIFWRGGRVVPTITSHNMDMVYNLDATDKNQLDDALVATKKMIVNIVDYYRRYIPGYEDAFLLRFAPMLGIRETRRIEGDHIITEDEALAETDFEDAIGRCGAYIDVHGEEPGMSVDFREVGGERGWFQIPYRSLLAKGVDGVLLAGRLISADHVTQGSVRNQIVCMTTGHAAGTAAALAAKARMSPRRIDVETLQATLKGQEVLI